jgi:GDP-6-deoxy-D-talose 4-dehydrogenase
LLILKIFVTGADGFTGRHFVTSAKEHGHDVIAMQTNLADKGGIAEELAKAKPDAVVHLAAIAFVGHSQASAFYDVNVLGTTNLLDALLSISYRPNAVLLASSANVYGNCANSPIAEQQQPEPTNHYAMSKLAMEQMSRNYMDRLPIFITRPFNYTGVGQSNSFLIPKLVSHFARKSGLVELGNLDVEREFNDVRMVCSSYLALLSRGITGEVYNVCTGASVKLRHVIDLLEEMTGHSIGVRVSPNLVRAGEVYKLFGCPDKLIKAIGDPLHLQLRETLSWMLDELLVTPPLN